MSGTKLRRCSPHLVDILGDQLDVVVEALSMSEPWLFSRSSVFQMLDFIYSPADGQRLSNLRKCPPPSQLSKSHSVLIVISVGPSPKANLLVHAMRWTMQEMADGSTCQACHYSVAAIGQISTRSSSERISSVQDERS